MQSHALKLAPSLLLQLCVLGAGIGTATGAELHGNIAIYVGNKQLRSAEASELVVYFSPKGRSSGVPRGEAPAAVMSMMHKQFVPRILPIQAGDGVYFPNSDPILHNAFSTTPYNSFDTGLQASGRGKSYILPKAGLVKVYCNVHRAMFGFILVLNTPFYTRPDQAGNFALKDLPEGSGELVVFHDRAMPWRQVITPGAKELSIRIDFDKKRVPPHFNKFGRPYARDGRGDY